MYLVHCKFDWPELIYVHAKMNLTTESSCLATFKKLFQGLSRKYLISATRDMLHHFIWGKKEKKHTKG